MVPDVLIISLFAFMEISCSQTQLNVQIYFFKNYTIVKKKENNQIKGQENDLILLALTKCDFRT